MTYYIDVDDTLIRWAGTKKIPMTSVIERVKKLHAGGHTLYLWSSGGADYAKAVALQLKIVDYFTDFLPKPDVILDDQAPADWKHCTHEYPLGGS